MDGLGNKLPIFGRGGYSYVANAYCQKHWCIRDIRESLFTYESSTDFEALRKCDETPFGYFDFGQASEELKCLCGDDQACLMDGILFGIDAAQATVQTQLQTQSSGLFRFSPNRVEVGKATEVTVTVDVRGNQSSLINATSFVLYAVDSDGQAGSIPLVSLVDSGSGRGDDMNANDHLFSNTITLYPNITGTLFGFQALPIIDGSLSNAFALQSNTAVQSYSEFNVSVDCDDGDLCTLASPVCNNGALECSFTPKSCNDSQSCDPLDGQCKGDEQLVPCVAVIDEDDDFRSGGGKDQASQWQDFRTQFPNRPFCLLVPEKGYTNVDAPDSFHCDNNTLASYFIRRDNGVVSLAEDWVTLCGLDRYTSANVEWVGLFIDDSGSMREGEVSASRDLFYSTLARNGIQVRKVVNTMENWIKPFMTTLVPSSMPPASLPASMTTRPVTAAPMTARPTTASPFTVPPVTCAPKTVRPKTASPSTAPPVTLAPATTARPTTASPSTAPPVLLMPPPRHPTRIPANDNCEDAVEISFGTINGTTQYATTDQYAAVHCGPSFPGHGVWYRFDSVSLGITVTTPVSVSTCVEQTNYDTQIIVYEGWCDRLICRAGNDDIGGACQTKSAVTIPVRPGKTYYALVHGKGSLTGLFGLSLTDVSTAPPVALAPTRGPTRAPGLTFNPTSELTFGPTASNT